ncbi:hypothetical protein AVEN_172305-1 [Araneus ventricosus]|uniref:Uncharacterized protein n=1 Tax=Araneus ventricosus TaxID=182803 RepID=A0A4Y2E503_ARAVE|nr:hypothetical protein AVEN_172305-1 [Araneus ventricosus]
MEKRGVVSRPCLIGSELRKEVLERGREISQMEVLRVLIAFREEREAYWEVSETVPVAPFGRSVCRRQRKRKLIMDGLFFLSSLLPFVVWLFFVNHTSLIIGNSKSRKGENGSLNFSAVSEHKSPS